MKPTIIANLETGKLGLSGGTLTGPLVLGRSVPVRSSAPSTGNSNLSARTVAMLAEYRNSGASATGAIIFAAPLDTQLVMHQFDIAIHLYSTDVIRFVLKGYRSGTTAFGGVKKVITEASADVQVRFGTTPSGQTCVILGDTTTVWSYPHVAITNAMFSHSGVSDAYCEGWTANLVTDLTGYYVTTTIADSTKAAANADALGGVAAANFARIDSTYQAGKIALYNTTNSNDVFNGALEVREVNNVTNTQSSVAYAPGITFHWSQTVASQIYMRSDGQFALGAQTTKTNYRDLYLNALIGTGDITLGTTTSTSTANPRLINMGGTHSNTAGANPKIRLFDDGTTTTRCGLGVSSGQFDLICGNTHQFRFFKNNGGTTLATLSNAGDFTATGNVTAYSDEKLKENIATIDQALDKVCQMRGVTFNRKDTGAASSGVVAQEFETVAPELVHEDDLGVKSVSYGNTVGYLIEAMKELKGLVDEQKTMIDALKAEIAHLKGE